MNRESSKMKSSKFEGRERETEMYDWQVLDVEKRHRE